MTESPERAYARHLAALDDEGFRSSIRRARFLATEDMPEGSFDPPIRTAGEYLDTPIEIPASLVYPTIVVRGEITTTLGRAGKGKTTFNLNRICKWSAGLPLFDDWEDCDGRPYLAPESPLKTLVIENEGSAGMFQHKLGTMLNREAYLTPEHRSLARDNVLIWGDGGFSDFKLDDEGKVNLLRAGCEKWKPDIIFLEPFRSLWRGEENSSTDMTEVINTLQVVAKEYNCGIILSHHERKSGAGDDGELMSAARGSGVLEGAVAVMENFQAVVGGAYREITWSKARYLQPPPTTRMEYQPADEWYTHVPASSLEERLLLLLEDNEEALTVRQLADMTDEKEDRLRNTLNAMYEQARAQRRAAIPGETGYRWKSVKAGPDDDQLPI